MSGRPQLPVPGQPPSLPARRPPPRPPSPDEYYSEFHGDAEIQSDSPPPPPPPRPGAVPAAGQGSEEIYDDFDEAPPPADFSQDVYEATDEVSPPPPPSSRPPPAIPSSSAPRPPPERFEPQEEVYADPDEQPEVYAAVDDEDAPAPPPIPPNRTKRDLPAKPEVPAGRPAPKPPVPTGGLVIDASSLANKLGNLRKTNAKPEGKSTGDKVYTDNSSFDDKKKLFEHRSSSVVEDTPVKSPTSSKSPSIVSLSKPSLPNRPNASAAKAPPKPPHSHHSSSSDSGGSLKSPAVPESPGSDGSEELYDDGSSFQIMDPLVGNSWYFPRIERREAEKQLNKHLGEDGTFLVRKSSRDPKKPYTIDVIYQKRIYHLQVRQRPDQNFALGTEKDDEMYFKDVKELVDHHKKKEVILIGDHPGSVLLKKSP